MPTRRRLLAALGSLGLGTAAGCSFATNPDGGDTPHPTVTIEPRQTTPPATTTSTPPTTNPTPTTTSTTTPTPTPVPMTTTLQRGHEDYPGKFDKRITFRISIRNATSDPQSVGLRMEHDPDLTCASEYIEFPTPPYWTMETSLTLGANETVQFDPIELGFQRSFGDPTTEYWFRIDSSVQSPTEDEHWVDFVTAEDLDEHRDCLRREYGGQPHRYWAKPRTYDVNIRLESNITVSVPDGELIQALPPSTTNS